MKTAEIIDLGSDAVLIAEATNREPSYIGRPVQVANGRVTLLLTDVHGTPDATPVTVADAHGMRFGWSSDVPYMVADHWRRPLVDDFGNVVTTPTGKQVTVPVSRIKETADALLARQRARDEKREREARERREAWERAAALRETIVERLVHYGGDVGRAVGEKIVTAAPDVESVADLAKVLTDASVREVQPNVWVVVVADPWSLRYGREHKDESMLLHLVNEPEMPWVDVIEGRRWGTYSWGHKQQYALAAILWQRHVR